MNQWVVLDYGLGLSVVGPFRTGQDAWQWVESCPLEQQERLRVDQCVLPNHARDLPKV